MTRQYETSPKSGRCAKYGLDRRYFQGINGIKLQGQIESFDQFVILLKNTVSQMVYKHAISTVVPSRNVRLTPSDLGTESDSE